jgi:trehalose-6-phosphate synthase
MDEAGGGDVAKQFKLDVSIGDVLTIEKLVCIYTSRDSGIYARSNQIQKNAPGAKILLGIDRLDYTKGIPEKLRAFKRFLTRFPNYHKRVQLIQVVVPSRREINVYADLKLKIEQLVGEINGIHCACPWGKKTTNA